MVFSLLFEIKMKYFQVIITFPGENAPKVYLISINDVDWQMRERMEEEVGNFPDWCSPCSGVSICDIDKIGKSIRVDGKLDNKTPVPLYEVTRTFWYAVG